MLEIMLESSSWNSPEDFYHDLLAALGAPDWHGHNLDALWDSITGGGINEVNPPFVIRVVGERRNSNCDEFLRRVQEMFVDARAQNVDVEMVGL